MDRTSSTPALRSLLPPQAEFGDIKLPNTRLHYVKAGSGPPLVQFMGQRFTAYFFELPGHGQSTPYPENFESSRVPETVESFVNAMGHGTFNLMGFSFGGLLALRTTLERLQSRISKVILFSTSLSQRAQEFQKHHHPKVHPSLPSAP